MLKARENLEKVKPYIPGKPVEELIRERNIKTDVIKLASNENPLGPSPLAMEKLRMSLHELHLYPDDGAFYLKRKLSQIHGVKPENIIVGNGSVEIILFSTLTYVDKGENVVMSDISFIMYSIATRITDGNPVRVKLENYRHCIEKIVENSRNAKVVFIDNPINPLGTVLRREEIKYLLDNIPEYVLVVIDEAYKEYIDDPEVPDSIKEFVPIYPNLLVLRTFSKIYGLASLRIGYGVGSENIIKDMMKVRSPFNVNRMAQIAALAALDDHEHVKRSKDMNNRGKEQLYKAFDEMNLFYLKSYSNFIYVDFKRDASPIYDELLNRGIIIRPLRAYNIDTALRITVGTEEENNRLIENLKEVLRNV